MKPLRGVNLGGWLVLEKWMTPGLFADTDAIDEYTFMHTNGAREKLQRHRDTFITEDDFAWLQANGIDAIRLPVGYWIIAPDEDYMEGISYVDWVFVMAKKYNLQVLLDLHGAPGSQSGRDHSGQVGEARWFHDDAYRKRTVVVLEQLHNRYKTHENYWGIELLNEPPIGVFHCKLRRFYKDAAARLDGNARIVFHDAFLPRLLSGALRRDPRAVMDVHLYHMASVVARTMSAERFVSLCGRMYRRTLRRVSRTQPVIIGEWSGVLRGKSLREKSPDEKATLTKRFVETQLAVYEAHSAGWFYWNYKTEHPGTWHFRSMVEAGTLKIPKR